ncbi:hypothetical protein BJX99DRAFT_255649 [Aspergillus californicus]
MLVLSIGPEVFGLVSAFFLFERNAADDRKVFPAVGDPWATVVQHHFAKQGGIDCHTTVDIQGEWLPIFHDESCALAVLDSDARVGAYDDLGELATALHQVLSDLFDAYLPEFMVVMVGQNSCTTRQRQGVRDETGTEYRIAFKMAVATAINASTRPNF